MTNVQTVVRSSVHALAILSLTFGSTVSADSEEANEQDELSPLIEDFFFTESVYPQEKGEIQLTTRARVTKDDDEGDSNAITVGLEYGITDSFQIEAEWTPWHQQKGAEDDDKDHTGGGDLELGFKYSFEKDQATGLQFAVGFELTVPLGDINNDLGEGFWVYEPYIVVSKDLNDSTNLTASLSYGFLDRDESPRDEDDKEPATDEIEINVGLVHAFAPAWRSTLELSLETNEQRSEGDETAAYFAPGLIYKGVDGIEIGAGIPIGLTDDSADWGIVGMLSIEF